MGFCREPPTLERDGTVGATTSTVLHHMNPVSTSVPERTCRSYNGTLCRAKLRGKGWLRRVMKLLETELEKNQPISWAAQPAITALLPLFYEHADTPAMIKHGMGS